MIDLQKFCSRDPGRLNINAPFSRGDFTYATDGRILVRVPRRDDVLEIAGTPDAERVFPKPPATEFRSTDGATLPPDVMEECEACGGSSTVHQCPSCSCECPICRGTGKISSDRHVSASIAGVPFDLRYLRLMLSLPNVEVAIAVPQRGPLEFRFDGGHGLLMPMEAEKIEHIDIGLAVAPS